MNNQNVSEVFFSVYYEEQKREKKTKKCNMNKSRKQNYQFSYSSYDTVNIID